MKKLILLFVGILFVSCDSNPNYEKNLATAKKLFELHGEEKIDEQLALVSKDMKIYTTLYDSNEPGDYDAYAAMLKGYQDTFEDIVYTPQAWLPGVDTLTLKPDGSVRTYGKWTGKNSITGKELDLNGYWYFNFDENGLVTEQGDFFDAGGMISAVYDVNHQDEIINIVNMSTNKSAADVEAFTEAYQNVVNRNEETSLSFRFMKAGKNKVTLIERYKNSEAVLLHVKNISPGGPIAKDFEAFTETFNINSMTLYGNVSDELKEALAPFQIKTNYVSVIAGYSR